MKSILSNILVTAIIGLVVFPIVLLAVSNSFLRCLACILVFYLLLNLGLDGIAEEYKAEKQSKIDVKKQINKK